MQVEPHADVAEAFADALARLLGDNLARVSLFGSRARGDHRSRSDYDLMIVLRRVNGEVRSAIHRLATEYELERPVDLSTKITDLDQFERLRSGPLPFWRNYRSDERVLWPRASSRNE